MPNHELRDHPRVRLVDEALRQAGLAESADAIRALPSAAPTARAAADQLGCEVGAIANSLVFAADNQPLLIMTSGAHRVDLARATELLGVGVIRRATAEEVRDWTGQPIGGVAPIGHPAPLGTLIDISLAQHEQLWAAAGHPHTVFPLTYGALITLTDGTPAEVVA